MTKVSLLPQYLVLVGILLLPVLKADGYDEDLAKKMLTYCSIAITEPEEVADWQFQNPVCNKRTPNDQIIQTYRDKDTAFGYIALNIKERYVVAAFKGSNGTDDWIDHDLRSLPLSYHRPCQVRDTILPGHVHHGFCTYYSELARQGLGDEIDRLHRLHHGFSIYVTGHSLGGAAAVVCAVDLITRFNIIPTVYTFGEPRTGDSVFAKVLTDTKRVFRVVHARDVVPHCAPCCGFRQGICATKDSCPYHHNTEVWYNNNMTQPGVYKVCPEDESIHCSNSLLDVSKEDHLYYFNVEVGRQCKIPPYVAAAEHQVEEGQEGRFPHLRSNEIMKEA